jgi:hypothetical protein
MKKHLFPLVLLACIIFSACQNQCPPLTDLQKADIEKQVLEVWDSIKIPLLKLDADGYSPFLSSDEYLGYYGGGTVIPSKAAVIDSLKVWFSYRKSQQFLQKKVTVTVLTENLVLINLVAGFEVENKNGEIYRGDDATSILLKKKDSGWKVIHEHESVGNFEQVTEVK